MTAVTMVTAVTTVTAEKPDHTKIFFAQREWINVQFRPCASKKRTWPPSRR